MKKSKRITGQDIKEPVLEIAGLRFTWPGKVQPTLIIDHLSVDQGELLFIKGASGSGKSTLLGNISGTLSPLEGSISVLGEKLEQMKGVERDRFRADNIGYIFQLFNLIPYLSVVENVILPCQFSKSREKRALDQSSTLSNEALRLLSQLNLSDKGVISKPVSELSVGQQQRVAAARALIGSPQLIIADEPTSSLDAAHRESFLQLLFDECEKSGATLVFVSHDSNLSTFFNRSIEMSWINSAPGLFN